MMRTFLALLIAGALLPATVRAADDKASDDAVDRPRIELFPAPMAAERPLFLPAMYASLGALQVYDGYSTLAGVNRGARESNAIVGGLAGNPAALWTLKAASTGVSIYLAERLWRDHHRGQAIAVMLASNAVMSVVAARNASVLKSSR